MIESFCNEPYRFFPSSADFVDLRRTFIANCIFNGFFTYSAIMLNFVTICAIRKTSTLSKTLKTLLTSLAISDVGIGLVSQPAYMSFLVSCLKLRVASCNAYRWLTISGTSFTLASFLGVVSISVDRFLAVRLHLRYQELVTHKRIVAVVISIWLYSVFVSLTILWVSTNTHSLIISITGACGFVITIIMYISIYLILRRHKNQIQALQGSESSQSGNRADFVSLMKSAVGVFYVYLVFLVSCLPFLICLLIIGIDGSSITRKKFVLFSVTLAFLNSSLNPVIYCWKMRQIRHAIMDRLRNMPWARIRTSR